ncbi:MAG: (Fe-S)-binding protein [Armatimonadota bacterium]|nr:(Fe-S)-binding protein [Armatimonadota bacterium]MCX7777367.1 (Fe-S)-binding protein [Armatimonadota bacterium]MDW8025365.1 (Fe-S)-binding protein [Armatimonadota bacterium]
MRQVAKMPLFDALSFRKTVYASGGCHSDALRPGIILSEDEHELLLDCVRCGFCLASCPAFAQTLDEADSPRGRLHLLRALFEGRINLTETLLKHFDVCLACRACQAVCPSGVRYGFLIELVRARLERMGYGVTRHSPLLRMLIKWVFPYRRRFNAFVSFVEMVRKIGLVKLASQLADNIAFTDRLRKWLQVEGMLPRERQRNAFYDGRSVIPPKGKRRMRVGFLLGCASDVLLKSVNEASVKVLAHLGCEVVIPNGQTCCGAIAMHVGFEEDAKRFARRNIEVFEKLGLDAIVTNAAGCGAAMKEYSQWLRDDELFSERAFKFSSLVRDFSELVCELPFSETMKPLLMRVTYDDPCHLLHAQGIREQPRKLIAAIPSIEFVELEESDICCGGAGIYGLLFSENSMWLLERKLERIRESGADVVVTANIGCQLQLQYGVRCYGLNVKVMHIAELLALSYEIGR